MRMRRDGTVHTGFPSYSADGKQIVFRVWGEQEKGLRILDLPSRKVWVLTTEYDNLPGWSPDGRRIVFTRKTSAANVDVFTIRPDGTGLRRLTTSGANDGHAVWTYAGRIMWNSGMYGFRDEATLYDDTFQPYGQIFVMHADGSNKRIVTDSLWEDRCRSSSRRGSCHHHDRFPMAESEMALRVGLLITVPVSLVFRKRLRSRQACSISPAICIWGTQALFSELVSVIYA
jgi:Tol biopolymer transport system component